MIGETNKMYECHVFNSWNQLPKETFNAYVAVLCTLLQTCNFCECIKESLIPDRIVLGIQNPQTRKRLLQERKLTLNKCFDICRSSETSTSQMKIISGTKTSEDINQVKEKTKWFEIFCSTLITWNQNGSHTTRYCKDHCHKSSKPQEVLCRVCRSDGRTNPFDRSKSCPTHEAPDNTLE